MATFLSHLEDGIEKCLVKEFKPEQAKYEKKCPDCNGYDTTCAGYVKGILGK